MIRKSKSVTISMPKALRIFLDFQMLVEYLLGGNTAAYTCREIGEQIGATDKQVAAMVSKARKFLKSRKDVLDLAGNI